MQNGLINKLEMDLCEASLPNAATTTSSLSLDELKQQLDTATAHAMQRSQDRRIEILRAHLAFEDAENRRREEPYIATVLEQKRKKSGTMTAQAAFVMEDIDVTGTKKQQAESQQIARLKTIVAQNSGEIVLLSAELCDARNVLASQAKQKSLLEEILGNALAVVEVVKEQRDEEDESVRKREVEAD